jgi:hypothetical protein
MCRAELLMKSNQGTGCFIDLSFAPYAQGVIHGAATREKTCGDCSELT